MYELMKRASTIYLYTSTPPLTCDGEDESTRIVTQSYAQEAMYMNWWLKGMAQDAYKWTPRDNRNY
jgi:hypothetical protein